MKLYYRYFCYGAVVTSIFWFVVIHIYGNILDSGGRAESYKYRLRSRHDGPFVRNGIESNEGNVITPLIKPHIAKSISMISERISKDGIINDEALKDLAVIQSPEDQRVRDDGYRNYTFNLLISNRIGFHRSVPDTRHHLCRTEVYSDDLPSASVIICFYNEAWSTLLRTIHSVLDRTPSRLLHEIVLVDDSSDLEHLGKELQEYLTDHVPEAHLIRTSSRAGLIRARITGADHATGEVIVFLDSHCEVNIDWIEPLLVRIQASQSNVAIPIIDIIDMDTMRYEASPLVRGGFNWGMFFRWDQIPAGLLTTKSDYIKPIKSPTMAGGLFAISREYFIKMGKYDPGLDIWGGENLEISFRIWQCGGRLEIIPCSRVGHIFRKRRPYGDPLGGDTMTRNSLRVAHVWLDEYKEHFFGVRPEARNLAYGDISSRIELRQHLQCKPFQWYLNNVYPEQSMPNESGGGLVPKGQPVRGVLPRKPRIKRKGYLYQRDLKLCVVAADGPTSKRSLLKLQPCTGPNKQSDYVWHETDTAALQLSALLCLDYEEVTRGRSYPRLMKCHFSGGNQGWIWNKSQLLNPASGKCLSSESDNMGSYITMALCNSMEDKQHFKLTMSIV